MVAIKYISCKTQDFKKVSSVHPGQVDTWNFLFSLACWAKAQQVIYQLNQNWATRDFPREKKKLRANCQKDKPKSKFEPWRL